MENRNQRIVSFIKQVFDQQDSFIPLHEPRFIGNEKKYLLDTIDSTFVSSVGEYVNRFEKTMAVVAGTKYAVATVNGTAALHIALKLAGVEPDTEVLTQDFTFVATANAISYTGAHSVFMDIEKESLGMCPDKLESILNSEVELIQGVPVNKVTKRRISACVPMHTFGLVGKIEEIISICNQYHIPVVEDAAECIGSSLDGKPAGGFGLLGTFSFNGNKTITCGGGGAIVTNDEALAKKAKYLTTTAKQPHAYKYFHDEIGYNYRMPNLNAALACAQLEKLNEFVENKRELAAMYAEFFNEQGITFIKEREGTKSNYWLNAILFNSLGERNEFLEYSNANLVMTRPGWELMHSLPMFQKSQVTDVSNAQFIYERLVNIPSSVRA